MDATPVYQNTADFYCINTMVSHSPTESVAFSCFGPSHNTAFFLLDVLRAVEKAIHIVAEAAAAKETWLAAFSDVWIPQLSLIDLVGWKECQDRLHIARDSRLYETSFHDKSKQALRPACVGIHERGLSPLFGEVGNLHLPPPRDIGFYLPGTTPMLKS